jgi:N-acetyl sugar amidotransferase
MDDTDRAITFDDAGVCDHCRGFDRYLAPHWTNTTNHGALEKMADEVRAEGRGNPFDCILGLSGGLDSSYLAHVAIKELGLRPLLFHVDAGWNSGVAIRNIEKLVDGLGAELFTEVINWREMQQFQVAYFRAGVSNIDIPQDHAFVATLYNYAKENRLRFILNGGNFATESVNNPLEWVYYGTDMAQIRHIRRAYCDGPLPTYPFSSVLRHKVYLRYVRKIKVVKPLNLVPFVKADAIATLASNYGFEYYGRKHFESRFTAFYEGYWLPTKFGYDTRKVQLSSLILSGQIDRPSALALIESPSYEPDSIDRDFAFIASKLGISTDYLTQLWAQPNVSYSDLPSSSRRFELGAKIMRLGGAQPSIKR